MAGRARKQPALAARIGGRSDLMAGAPNEIKRDLKRGGRFHPQGAGGVDPAEDTEEKAKKRTKRRVARVLW